MAKIHVDVESLVPSGSQYRALTGYSGTTVVMIEKGGSRWVRKISKSSEGNDRLIEQASRQEDFRQRIESIRTPRVLDSGTIYGLAFIDMEIVRGVDSATYLRTADIDDLSNYIRSLALYFSEAHSLGPSKEIVVLGFAAAVEQKLNDIERLVIQEHPEFCAAIDGIRTWLPDVELPDNSTYCHGDLTLENLLVDESGVIWAIDQTPPPFEHVWLDAAKLEQDVIGGWYLRRFSFVPNGVRVRLITALSEVVGPGYRQARPLLLGLTFARILPYLQSQEDQDLVLEAISRAISRTRTH